MTSDGYEHMEDLRSALITLRGYLDAYEPRQYHFAGDLSLLGFALTALEGGTATERLVRDPDVIGTAGASARAALEGGQDALLLATEPDYDAAGCRVRVFERFEYAILRSDIAASFGIADFGDVQDNMQAAEHSLRADAEQWERVRAGAMDLMREPIEHFRPLFLAARNPTRRGRHPSHWAELSRTEIANLLEQRIGTSGSASRMRTAYAALSRNTHPRVRAETWRKGLETSLTAMRAHDPTLALIVTFAELGVRLAADAWTAAVLKKPENDGAAA